MEYNITINRENLIKPLQYITNIISNRPVIPIINNILIDISESGLITLKSTNLEIEMTYVLENKFCKAKYSITISGKKFYNICRSLPNKSDITISLNNNRAIISSKKCSFVILTLPTNNFPVIDFLKQDISFTLNHKIIKTFINSTYFSIANNDVRKYLNGLFLEIKNNILSVVSTDGHRLSIFYYHLKNKLNSYSVIIPRKSIFELSKLVNDSNELVNIKINKGNICFIFQNFKFISKLIESNFPDYNKIMPKKFYVTIKVNRIFFKNALKRVSLLVNENTKSVTLFLNNCNLKIFTSNIDNEKAEESLTIITYNHDFSNISISFNINYLIDVLNILDNDFIKISFIDEVSSIKIEDYYKKNKIYFIMPMKT
ncbi:DNA polymerase III subunit beta [Enterobacteriaceae endosymbiont of Donacia tomentosa]|uniref:DNA polymerase III subunit beta n=1 Tax=Enterobacteriaceae endosymbiont of Donacia tomentosa TaxID=2675787 RepID=UPI001449541E|nr:DNA polymerase III subunit beta [Enterobacteriaceae endosymbiont of Donacia tomentosa]QJC31849.1 DNA polymerase III subunit beta [Enterobacteriaceae endosymbiont of Donacia tomentosa]